METRAKSRIPISSVQRHPVVWGQWRRWPPSTLGVLKAALEAIGAPALITASRGEILLANLRCHALVARDSGGVARSLADALANKQGELSWDLTPFQPKNGPQGFLAVLREPPPRAVGSRSIDRAKSRWKLTTRQTQVLDLLAQGITNVAISEALRIRVGTVEFHISSLFDKAGVDNRATLIARMHQV